MKREPFQTSQAASLIMQRALEQCRALYPKGTRLVVRFHDRGPNTICTVRTCLGTQYTVRNERNGEILAFHPEINPHRVVSPQQDLFQAQRTTTQSAGVSDI